MFETGLYMMIWDLPAAYACTAVWQQYMDAMQGPTPGHTTVWQQQNDGLQCLNPGQTTSWPQLWTFAST